MPAQKRSHDTISDDTNNSSPQRDQSLDEQAQEESTDSGSHSSSIGEQDEFITVKLGEMRKEVQCPICLGIIRKTRTVMECLHRFCRECIDKSMRLGNNECPACRTHCASRRSLRDDPNYDALIATLYPDIDKYEEEELAFHEDEKTRNKQIQASIAQTLRRQSEALRSKRTSARVSMRLQGSYRRRRNQGTSSERPGSDEEDANSHDEAKDSSSANEQETQVKLKRYKRRQGGARTNLRGGGDEIDDSGVNRDLAGPSLMVVGGWGGVAARSNKRHGSQSAGNGKNAGILSAGNGKNVRIQSAGNGKEARIQNTGNGKHAWIQSDGNGSDATIQSNGKASRIQNDGKDAWTQSHGKGKGTWIPSAGNGNDGRIQSDGNGMDAWVRSTGNGMDAWVRSTGNGKDVWIRSAENGKGPRIQNTENRIDASVRLSKLRDSLQKEDDESNIIVMLVPLDEQRVPCSQVWSVYCGPASSIRHIRQRVAMDIGVQAEEVELMLVKKIYSKTDPMASPNVPFSACASKDELYLLEEHETLAELQSVHNFGRLLHLAYRRKFSGFSLDSR